MKREDLKDILNNLKNGKSSLKVTLERLSSFPYMDIDIAKIDTHRGLRKGFPEVVLGLSKSPGHLVKILTAMDKRKENVIITKLRQGQFKRLKEKFKKLEYYPEAKIAVLKKSPVKIKNKGMILIVSAGTSDIPIAEEAYITCKYMGNKVEKLYDVGVAGIHRLLDKTPLLQKASVVIVVAGMEGALASVVGGLTSKPVIGVPTSVGYGSSFRGVSALLGMLNTCSPGVVTVNIDNGFGAGYFASTINR